MMMDPKGYSRRNLGDLQDLIYVTVGQELRTV
jgi:hypothetical protein